MGRLAACPGMEPRSTPLFFLIFTLRAAQGQQTAGRGGSFVKTWLHGSKFKLTITASVQKPRCK